MPTLTWADYLHAALDEIRHWGAGSLQVQRRLRWLFEDLLSAAPPERRAAIEEQMHLLEARTEVDLAEVERSAVRQRVGGATSPTTM